MTTPEREPVDDPHPHDPRLGLLLDGDHVLDLTHEAARIPQPKAYLDWFDLDGGPMHEVQILGNAAANDAARLEGLIAAGAVTPKSDVRLLAPVPRPGKLICIGLNYALHAKEGGHDIPTYPSIFLRMTSSLVAAEVPFRSRRGRSRRSACGAALGRSTAGRPGCPRRPAIRPRPARR